MYEQTKDTFQVLDIPTIWINRVEFVERYIY